MIVFDAESRRGTGVCVMESMLAPQRIALEHLEDGHSDQEDNDTDHQQGGLEMRVRRPVAVARHAGSPGTGGIAARAVGTPAARAKQAAAMTRDLATRLGAEVVAIQPVWGTSALSARVLRHRRPTDLHIDSRHVAAEQRLLWRSMTPEQVTRACSKRK